MVGSVIGGFMALGGHLDVLWQPFEFVIIGGAAIGAFVISNPKRVIGGVAGSFGVILKGPKYKKESYLELLSVMYSVFRLAKSKGDLALESHVEKPKDSAIFQRFPSFASDHHAVEFFCDYLRLLTLGASTGLDRVRAQGADRRCPANLYRGGGTHTKYAGGGSGMTPPGGKRIGFQDV